MRSVLCTALLVLLTAACSHVSSQERGMLAHPSMAGDGLGPGAAHVYAVQEGAVGGGRVPVGTCLACN